MEFKRVERQEKKRKKKGENSILNKVMLQETAWDVRFYLLEVT